MSDFFPEIDVSDVQAEAIARGLFAVAHVDGVHEREAALIAQFYAATAEGAVAADFSELERTVADVDGPWLASALPTTELRELFVKTAFLLAYADGRVSIQERERITAFAVALGVDNAGMQRLEAGVKDYLLRQLAGLSNVEAVAQVAKKLGV